MAELEGANLPGLRDHIQGRGSGIPLPNAVKRFSDMGATVDRDVTFYRLTFGNPKPNNPNPNPGFREIQEILNKMPASNRFKETDKNGNGILVNTCDIITGPHDRFHIFRIRKTDLEQIITKDGTIRNIKLDQNDMGTARGTFLSIYEDPEEDEHKSRIIAIINDPSAPTVRGFMDYIWTVVDKSTLYNHPFYWPKKPELSFIADDRIKKLLKDGELLQSVSINYPRVRSDLEELTGTATSLEANRSLFAGNIHARLRITIDQIEDKEEKKGLFKKIMALRKAPNESRPTKLQVRAENHQYAIDLIKESTVKKFKIKLKMNDSLSVVADSAWDELDRVYAVACEERHFASIAISEQDNDQDT